MEYGKVEAINQCLQNAGPDYENINEFLIIFENSILEYVCSS